MIPGGIYPPSRPGSHGSLRSWLEKREGHVRLPPSPRRRAASATLASAMAQGPLQPYRWLPVQTYAQLQDGEKEYFLGTYVSTLSMSLDLGPEAVWEPLPLAPDSFRAAGAQPQCCKFGGDVVFCRGQVVGCCPQEHDSSRGRKAWIARLPEGMRPRMALHFAALCEESPGAPGSFAADGHSAYRPHLVTLTLTPDGWLRGLGVRGTEAALDLSALRFSTGRGIAIADTVRLHCCDVGGRRLVVLQGSLLERTFDDLAACDNHDVRPLLSLPQTCRPALDQAFVVPGHRAGGFHLVRTQPSAHFGFGGGLAWCDSVWQRDSVSLSGVVFEASAEVARLPMDLQEWNPVRRHVVITDFQKLLKRKHGSIEDAWSKAFDLDGSGAIDFSEFASACKALGYVGNATRLWAMLDEDSSGEISLEELSACTHEPGPPSAPGTAGS